MPRTRRLTRYLLSELTAWTLLAVALWVGVLLMNQFFLVARLALQKDLPTSVALEILGLYVPQTLLLALPMGTLLGVLIAIGRLSSDHEIVAVQAAGLGPGALFRPVLLLGAGTTLVALVVYGVVLPRAAYEIRTIQSRFAAIAGIANEIRPRVFLDQIPGFVLYVDGLPPGSRGRAQGVLLYQANAGGGEDQLILAREAEILSSSEADGAVALRLHDGVSHRFRATRPEGYRIASFGGYGPVTLVQPSYLRGSSRLPTHSTSDMSPAQLVKELGDARLEPDDVIRPFRVRAARVEFHARLALPLACLVLASLALPLGITRARSGKGAAFAMSLVVILAYYLLYTSLRNQALAGRLGIVPGLWTTNAVMFVAAIVAYARLRRPPRDRGWGGRSVDFFKSAFRRISGREKRPVLARAGPEAAPEVLGPLFVNRGGLRILSRLDAYIMKSYLRLTLLAGAFTYLIFLLLEVKRFLDAIAERRASVAAIAAYFAWFTPGTLWIVIPIACLMGAVVTCTLLGRQGELTAMKAGGMSMRRAIAPILVATLGICGLSFALQNHIAPDANRRAQEIKDTIEGRSPRTYGQSIGGRWIFGEAGHLYHYRFYDPVGREFQGLTTLQTELSASPPRLTSHCYATSARWNGVAWDMRNGWCRSFGTQGAFGDFRAFAFEQARLDPPEQFERRERTIVRGGDATDEMSLEELREQIESLALAGYDTTRLEVAWHSKIARPLTPLVMVLLGLPFAFQVGRRGSMYGVGVALALVIVYWAGFAISNALGIEAILPPLLAAWSPNVLFAGLGAYLILYIRT